VSAGTTAAATGAAPVADAPDALPSMDTTYSAPIPPAAREAEHRATGSKRPVSLVGGIWLAALLGIAIAVGLMIWGDGPAVIDALQDFPLPLFGLVVLCTLWNYALRWVKWQIYLGTLGLRALSLVDSGLVFLSGLALGLTPARAGEIGKGIWIRQLLGPVQAPLARTAPIVLAERITDGLALLILAATGLVVFRIGVGPLIACGVLFALVIFVLQVPRPAHAALGVLGRVPRLSRIAATLSLALTTASSLLAWRTLIPTLALSVVSWSGECLALYLVLRGLGAPAGFDLLNQATFALAAASLVGTISIFPGGLGMAEATVAGILQAVAGQPRSVAVAATLLIRVSTLWLGVALGLVALAVLTRRIRRLSSERESRAES
jgi:uncharacterized protein (TIRG00374 family)